MILLALALSAAGCVQIEGDRVVAGDLAKAIPEFAAVKSSEAVSFSPLPGARRVLARADIARLAARFGLAVQASDAVCFEMKTAPLEAAAILKALEAAVVGAEVELVEFDRTPAPAGRMKFAAQGVGRPSDGAVLFRGRIEYGGTKSFPIWARARVKAERTRVLAAEGVAGGQPVREVTVEGSGDGLTAADVVGKIARRRIRQGEEIEAGMLAAPRDVAAGDTVTVAVASGSARLKFPAKATAGGRRGDTVVMTNPASGARFAARITGPGAAAVVVSGKDSQ